VSLHCHMLTQYTCCLNWATKRPEYFSGIIVNVGYENITVHSVVKGRMDKCHELLFGSADISTYFLTLLKEEGNEISAEEYKETKFLVESKKKELARVAVNLEDTFNSNGFISYSSVIRTESQDSNSYISDLPSDLLQQIIRYILPITENSSFIEKLGYLQVGNSVSAESSSMTGMARYLCMEPYFVPDILFSKAIPDTVIKIVSGYGTSTTTMNRVQEHMLQNIVLNGGATSARGFSKRTKIEVAKKFPNVKVKIKSDGEDGHVAWRGAAKITSNMLHHDWKDLY